MSYIQFSKYHQEALKKVELFIANKFDVPREYMYQDNRNKNVVAARAIAYHILYRIYGFSSLQIADLFRKDHTTILHGLNRIKEWNWQKEVEDQFIAMFPSTKRVWKSPAHPVDNELKTNLAEELSETHPQFVQ